MSIDAGDAQYLFSPVFRDQSSTFLHFGRGKCVGQAACLLARIEAAETV